MRIKELRLYVKLRNYFSRILDIRQEKENETDIIESIKKGTEFKGTNLWVLIFAIYIASLGLNTNSTAVIIGAMLISPLMGPIMGFGLALGINDFELLKRSLKNFATATIFSVITSTVYFLISPLAEAQSELLARTQPSIYDVLIAFFGGLAGVVAITSKSKGNVIPGVAIATALMPPLCTAGFGIATGNLHYFLGAFYLYFINTVFISFATLVVIRILGFQKKTFVDKDRQKKVTRYITIILLFTLIPSTYITYNMVKESWFKENVNDFISKELNFPGTHIIDKEIKFDRNVKQINIVTVGEHISDEALRLSERKLKDYKLDEVKLSIKQGVEGNAANIEALKTMVLQDFYQNAEKTIYNQSMKIDSLSKKIKDYESVSKLNIELFPEFKTLFPKVKEISISNAIAVEIDSSKIDTLTFVYLKNKVKLSHQELETIEKWLKVRTKSKSIKLIAE